MSWMNEATNFAIDSARVAVDNEDGLLGRTNQIRPENAGAGDGSVGRSPLGQIRVQW